MAVESRFAYPPTHRDESVIDDYHGTPIADPYRWLEDPNSPETQAWVESQNAVTFAQLSAIPGRDELRERLTQLWDYDKRGLPYKRGGRWFQYRNSGLQNQSVLFVADAPDGDYRVLLDPNTLSDDGTIALGGTAVSENGQWLAYSISRSGSDWQEWRVRDIVSGEDLADHIEWSKFSGASWTHDHAGFYYSRYDAPAEGEAYHAANLNQKLCYHRLGTDQSEEVVVYARPDQPKWGFGGHVTDDGRYLVIHIWHGTEQENALCYQDLSVPDSPVVPLRDQWDAAWDYVGNDGATFFVQTNLDSPRKRLLAIDLAQPEAPTELIAQSEDNLQGISFVGERFVASYLHHAHTSVRIFKLDGSPAGEVELPGLGSAGGFGGRREELFTFYSYTSFTVPGAIYRYDLVSGESSLFWEPELAFDGDAYETRQVFYRSKDGTSIPMFIVARRGLELDGSNPVYLYGYGGFNISLTPGFAVTLVPWLERGGVYAVANLRGGGEYGHEWHDAGRKLLKQNVFDDFIAAAEWLIDAGYTRSERLAIAGGSNGGLLVGACLTQRPDLFGCALPAVGVLDMLRFHRFTIGWGWASDYGCADDAEEFGALLAYSPLHNVRPGTHYPPTLITTSDHDDRVVPAHSFKFAAALQAAQAGDAPVLIRIETKAGHGAGKPTTKVIEEAADRWAFVLRSLGLV